MSRNPSADGRIRSETFGREISTFGGLANDPNEHIAPYVEVRRIGKRPDSDVAHEPAGPDRRVIAPGHVVDGLVEPTEPELND